MPFLFLKMAKMDRKTIVRFSHHIISGTVESFAAKKRKISRQNL